MNLNFVCPHAPLDKRGYIKDLGTILVKDFGKKKYYEPKEVKQAHKKSNWSSFDFSCWGMSTFSSHSDFDNYHKETGEVCDYVAMKAEMLDGISTSDINLSSLTDFDWDTSWLDLGELFGNILGGIGEFFSSIADSIGD